MCVSVCVYVICLLKGEDTAAQQTGGDTLGCVLKGGTKRSSQGGL